jgi:hypothetical protein
MKTVVTLAMVALLSAPALTSSALDVSGTWDLEMRWAGDTKSTGVCTFNQEGEKLAGSCGGADQFPLTGRLQNNRLSWQFDVKQDGGGGRMEFAGELDQQGTTITGSCRIVGGQDGTFTMKRQRS